MIKVKKDTLELPVKLTYGELLEYGKKLAALKVDQMALVEDKKSKAKAFAFKIGEIETEIADLSRTVKSGEEERTVQVEEEFDFGSRLVTVRRLDTFEKVSQRPMDYDELQLEMELRDREARQAKLNTVDGGKSKGKKSPQTEIVTDAPADAPKPEQVAARDGGPF